MADQEFHFDHRVFANQKAFIDTGCRCATAVPTDLQICRVDEEIESFRRSPMQIDRVSINVHFIHIKHGEEGKISEQQRVKQIEVMNKGFESHGVTFHYDPKTVQLVDRPDWFRMGHRSATERQAKSTMSVDPTKNLNLYTAAPRGGILGWATFPFDLAGDPVVDGVVVLHSAFPGGSAEPYNLGQTATHEVGHWLGLYHTFEPRGRCDMVGDFVDDTVAHSDPDFGKPADGVYTACDGTSHSPIHNFMNYTDDEWMTHFTEQQGLRMRDQIGVYRPELARTASATPRPSTKPC